MSVITLIKTKDYIIKGEFLWFGVILHSDVYKWGKDIRKLYRKHIQLIASSVGQPVYAFQTSTHDPKKRKFIGDVGLTFHHFRLTETGEWAEMFTIRPLDQSKGKHNGRTI